MNKNYEDVFGVSADLFEKVTGYKDSNPEQTHWNVTLTYFKRTGKYYTEGTFNTSHEYMWRVVEEIRDMRSRGETLPGLSSSGEEFIIHLDSDEHPNAVPSLII